MNGLLNWICAPQCPVALRGLECRPSMSFWAHPSRSPLHLPFLNSTSGPPPFQAAHLMLPKLVIFPFQTPLSFIPPEPQLDQFRSHKSRLTTLEFNFAHFPVQNGSEIQGEPLPSLHRGWIVCFRVSWHWWDRSFSGSHWKSIQLHSNHWIGLRFRFYLLSLLNHF